MFAKINICILGKDGKHYRCWYDFAATDIIILIAGNF